MEHAGVATVERSGGVRRSRDGATPAWQEATVAEVIDETPDAVTLPLRLGDAAGFLPGQYYNVHLAVPGQPRPVQRASSVGSSPVPDPSMIDLGIREVPGGLLSPLLVGLRAGEWLSVRGPYGRFTWDGCDTGPVLLVGAGSEMVPLLSMVRHAAQRGRRDPVVLVCSAITYSHVFYREELAALVARHPWLRVVHCIIRDPAKPRAHFHRRVYSAVLSESLDGNHPVATSDLRTLWDAVREELAERTVGPDLDPSDLGPQMTVAEAPEAMAALLTRAGDGDDDEQW